MNVSAADDISIRYRKSRDTTQLAMIYIHIACYKSDRFEDIPAITCKVTGTYMKLHTNHGESQAMESMQGTK